MDDDHLIRSNAGVAMSENVVMNRIAPGLGDDELTRWLKEAYTDERRDAEVNRQKTKLALVDEVAGEPGSYTTTEGIRVYTMPNGFAEPPVACFRWGMDTTTERVHSPSWSPDGTKLAFEEEGALMVLPVGDISGADCKVPEVGASKVLDAVRQPDWGPADVPTGRPAGGQQPGGGGQHGGGPAGPGPGTGAGRPVEQDGGAPAVLTASVKRAKLAIALRKGLKVTVAAPGAGRLRATATRGGKIVARSTARVTAAGPAAMRLRFTAKGRKALKPVRRAALKVAVVFTPAAGAPVSRTVAVKLAR